MKKLNLVLMVVMSIALTGCHIGEATEYYEYCDSYGNCMYSSEPIVEPQKEVVYVYEEAPSSHSHSEDTYVYYDDSHNHSQVIIVEDNGYDPYYYEFHNNFQEFCYAEGTPYHTTTCWVEYCYDHWITNDWYVWDEWCE